MLLSIVIPAYDRPDALLHALEIFAQQISGKYDRDIEIIITDDASPGHSLAPVEAFAAQYPFVTFRRRSSNLGLERSLIAAAEGASGEYLWIFGDDDYPEYDGALDDIVAKLRQNRHDMLVLNRTRRNSDLSKVLSPNWMKIAAGDTDYDGLRAFCRDFGFISVIGFISVNIFRRAAFLSVDPAPYYGSMYPQLGMMLEAFHNRPVCLIGKPTVCHRTQTQEEKRAALGNKGSEADFMADTNKRNALYFSHPFVRMLTRLKDIGAFTSEDICKIPENTVINGLLIQFLLDTVERSVGYPDHFDEADWRAAVSFFASLGLEGPHRQQLQRIAHLRFGKAQGEALLNQAAKIPFTGSSRAPDALVRTVSVITPSYNQAEFLDECLSSVAGQSLKPIEHFVYDPGSKDGSQDIARKYGHLQLFTEPDKGQSDAINKGFRAAKGDIIAWLNSDDVFADPGVFQRVVDRFNQPDRPDIVYGKGIYIDEHGAHLRDVYLNKKPETLPWRLQQEDGILQPALFMRRSVVEKVGEINGGLHFCMDYEYWIRCVKAGIKFAYIDENLALARYHTNNKTYGQRGKSYAEVCDMLVNHFGYANHNWLRRYAEFLSEGFDGVLAHAANTTVKNEAEIERHYVELLKAYNTGALTYEMLKSKPSERGYGDTLRELGRLGLAASTPCRQVPLETAQEPGHVCYTVGPKRWAFDATWKRKQIEKSHAFLRDRIAKRTSDVCVIVGNGPSLKNSNLDLLKGHDVIISNNAFLEPKLLECAKYYTVVNYLVAEQSSQNINRLRGVPKVLPYWMSYCLNEDDDTYFVDAVGHAAFSKDMFKNMSWRHTVTFYNLHLAFGLGYKRVVMIGFDHFYTQSKDVKEGDIILSSNEDPNHFDSRYFQGKKWQAADVDMMEAMYRLAQTAYTEEGREIINATAGGALEIFPRMDLEAALKGEAKRLNGEAKNAAIAPAPKVAPRPAPNQLAGPSAALGEVGYGRAAGASVDETEVVATMLSDRVGRKHVMVDVGAHFGTSAGYFHNLGWTIHCFEPDPANRAKLVAKLGNSRTVSIDHRAVSDKPAQCVAFFTSAESTGISGLHSFRETHAETARVDVTTVAEIVRDRGLSNIDFLKIDVEGFDFSVLKGVPWDKIRPDVIEAEFEDAKTVSLGHTYRDVCDYLVQRGYTVYLSEWHPIVRYGIPHDWCRVIRYPEKLITDAAWGNLLAFKDDPGLDEVQLAFASKVTLKNPSAAGAILKAGQAYKPKASMSHQKPAPAAGQPAAAPAAVKQDSSKSAPEAAPVQAAPATKASAAPGGSASAWHPQAHRDNGLPMYTRFALWAKDTSPLMFALGRIVMRVVRKAKRYWPLSLLAVAGVAGLGAVYLLPALAAYRLPVELFPSWLNVGLIGTMLLFGLGIAFAHYRARWTGRRMADLMQSEIGTLRRQLLIAERANAKLSRDMEAQSANLAKQAAATAAQSAAIAAQTSSTNARLAEFTDQYRSSDARISSLVDQHKAANAAIGDLKDRLVSTSTRLTELAAQNLKINERLSAIGERAEAANGNASAVGKQIVDLAAELAGIAGFRTEAGAQLKSIEVLAKSADERAMLLAGQVLQAQESSRALARSVPPNNALGYQTFNRMLRRADAETLATKWSRALSVSLDPKTLHYMADKACTLEAGMQGRLATSIETILLRTVVAMGVNRRDINILEIGTLFGVGAAIMYEALSQRFDHVHLTLLDPLDGYYAQGKPDIQTGQLVNEKTLRRNLSRVGISEQELTLIKRFSTDDEAIREAARNPIDVLIIDGDHSLSGVKADFENYGKKVRLGGFIIFDDYDSPDWPDIKGYVDTEIRGCGWLAHIGNEFRTAVFRVTRRAENDDSGAGG